ncbi:MAG: PdxA family protein [Burkholderiales bacterium]
MMNPQVSKPRIAIALGDPAGIGPEIALKAAMDPEARAMCTLILVGDPRVIEAHAALCGLHPYVRVIERAHEPVDNLDGVWLLRRDQFADEALSIGSVCAANGRAAIDSTRVAIAAAIAGEVDAVVAAPQTELAIKAAGFEFDGYPSFVARCTGTPIDDAYLMICFDAMRIVHATLHVSVRRAIELVTRKRVESAIAATVVALNKIGIAAPRIAVSGLNPHAGEGGMFGDEEIETIAPAIASAKARGIHVDGPFGADTMFAKTGYDAFIVMMHDQGHVAAKTLALNRTAGMTIGTPIVFSSVAHGSALDIAGKNKANHHAMLEALRRVVGARAGSNR